MKIHNLGHIPKGLDFFDHQMEVDELTDYDIQKLEERYGIDEAWYWYATAPYEGSGWILLKKGKLYDLWNMGHCSCYGPIEDQRGFNGQPIKSLKKGCSAGTIKETQELFDMAGV